MKHAVSATHTKPLRGLVTIRHKDEIDPGSDEFMTNTGEKRRIASGIGRTPLTALPDHVGVCEVVDVGPGEKYAKQGDICMLDFYETKQPYMVDGENLFIADAEALRCWVEPVSGTITPFPQYVLTKRAAARMALAYFGTKNAIIPEDKISRGFPGRTIWSPAKKAEVPCFFVTYEEVVALGSECIDKGVEVGDLAVIVTDFAMAFRGAGGINYRLTTIGLGCLGTIDDEAIGVESAKRQRVSDCRKSQSGLLIL